MLERARIVDALIVFSVAMIMGLAVVLAFTPLIDNSVLEFYARCGFLTDSYLNETTSPVFVEIGRMKFTLMNLLASSGVGIIIFTILRVIAGILLQVDPALVHRTLGRAGRDERL